MKRLFLVSRIRGHAWDSKQPMKSQALWAEHATFMDDLATSRFVVLGGPVGDEDKILLVVDASDENEIRSILGRDPWSESGILEVESIQRWTVLLQAGPEDESFVLRLLPAPTKGHRSGREKTGSGRG